MSDRAGTFRVHRFARGGSRGQGQNHLRAPQELTEEIQGRTLLVSKLRGKTLNTNVAALQDRGHVLLFQPGATEVHEQAGKWFEDREIYDWLAANLHRVREPSLRHYVRAKELKAAGMDWTDVLAVEDENRRARLAAELLASDAHNSTAARVKAFVAQGGGCRATFFNYRKRLRGGKMKDGAGGA